MCDGVCEDMRGGVWVMVCESVCESVCVRCGVVCLKVRV